MPIEDSDPTAQSVGWSASSLGAHVQRYLCVKCVLQRQKTYLNMSCNVKHVRPAKMQISITYHYENMPIQIYWTFYHQKMKIFRWKIMIIFIFLLKIDCVYSLEPPHRGGSNEYPQSLFLSRNKKNNVYPCKPQFYYIKVGFKGVKII